MSKLVNQRVLLLAELVHTSNFRGVTQVIPTFCSLAIHYNPLHVGYDAMVEELVKLNEMIDSGSGEALSKGRKIVLPIVYGGERGPDLEYVAEQTGMLKEDVIRLHAANTYFIYMLGVIGSFPYCGDLDSSIALKRRTSPRIRVEKGSVAIANLQTIVIPVASPSGWHIIGWTPMETFNPELDPPSIFLPGDHIKFEPISAVEAENWNETKQREWNERWN